jgi:hypothetical protein
MTCTGGAHNTPNRLFWNNGLWNSFTRMGVKQRKFIEVTDAGGAAGIEGAAVGEHAAPPTSWSARLRSRRISGSAGDERQQHAAGVHGRTKQLFQQPRKRQSLDGVRPAGTTSNRDGVGSKVYVTSGGVTQYREQNGATTLVAEFHTHSRRPCLNTVC